MASQLDGYGPHHHHHHCPPRPPWWPHHLPWPFWFWTPYDHTQIVSRSQPFQREAIRTAEMIGSEPPPGATDKSKVPEPDCPEFKHQHQHEVSKPLDSTPWPPIKLEGVIVCVDYSDFLAWTLPFNRDRFDNLIVVTTPGDTKTQGLCSHYHVRCVTTDVFHAGGRAFNKAAGINVGLRTFKADGWVIHMDADILLPPRAKEMIERSQPRTDTIYGIDRMNCPDFESAMKFFANPEEQYYKQAFLQFNAFEMGSRLIREQGYVPIGFFQMWHPQGSGIKLYSEVHDDHNNHSDVTHAEQWPRNRRGFIPEIVGVHLQSENDGRGNNWRGRKSKPFGPSK